MINASYNNIISFEISLVNFLNVLGFSLLASEKNGGDTLLICYFFGDKYLLFFDWSWYMVTGLGIFLLFVQVSGIFERLLKCYFAVSISFTRKFRKTHTHTPDSFSLKNHRQSFFLNHLFLQFNSRINRGFYFCE